VIATRKPNKNNSKELHIVNYFIMAIEIQRQMTRSKIDEVIATRKPNRNDSKNLDIAIHFEMVLKRQRHMTHNKTN